MQTIIDYHNNYIHSLNEENKDELEYFANVNDVIEEYKNLDFAKGMNIVIIDATQSVEEISKIVWSHIAKLPIFNS